MAPVILAFFYLALMVLGIIMGIADAKSRITSSLLAIMYAAFSYFNAGMQSDLGTDPKSMLHFVFIGAVPLAVFLCTSWGTAIMIERRRRKKDDDSKK